MFRLGFVQSHKSAPIKRAWGYTVPSYASQLGHVPLDVIFMEVVFLEGVSYGYT